MAEKKEIIITGDPKEDLKGCKKNNVEHNIAVIAHYVPHNYRLVEKVKKKDVSKEYIYTNAKTILDARCK